MRFGFGVGVGLGDGVLNGAVIARARPGDYAALGGVSSFTRADATACATQIGATGLRSIVAADVLRDAHYIAGVRTTLLEESRINICLRSNAYATAPFGENSGVTVATQDQIGPTGAANYAWSIARTVGAGFGGRFQAIALTTGHGYGVTAWVKKTVGAVANYPGVIAQRAAGVSVSGIVVDPTAGTAVAITSYSGLACIAPSNILVESDGAYWRCEFVFACNSTANWNYVVEPAINVDGTGVCVAGKTGTQVFADSSCEDGAFVTSHIATAAAAVTRAPDALALTGIAGVGAATLFYRYWDLATVAWANLAAAYTFGDPIVPAVNRAYADFVILRGTLTTNQAAAVLGY